MKLSRLIAIVGLCAALTLSGHAQGTDFYQQLTVGSTVVTPTGVAGRTFCRGIVENAPIRFTTSGVAPTASIGQPAYVGDRIDLRNTQDIRALQAIAATTTSGVLNLSCGSGTPQAESSITSAPTLNPTIPSVVVAAPTVIQQVQKDLTACTPISATAAINNTVTLTLTPPSGQYVYLCNLVVGISNNATGTVASTNLTFTSTNLGGWLWKFSDVGTANVTTQSPFVTSTRWLLRSQVAGTAVTIVSPAVNAQAAYNINAAYYFQ